MEIHVASGWRKWYNKKQVDKQQVMRIIRNIKRDKGEKAHGN